MNYPTKPDAPLNDSLDDIFGAPIGEVRTSTNAPEGYVPGATPAVANKFKETRQFTEACRKCRGTGRYNAPSSHGSRCFECDGVGTKTFRTSPEQRAKAKSSTASRKAAKGAAIAVAKAAAAAAFRAANPVICSWIDANAESFGFAKSMLAALNQWGSLTPGQTGAIERLIAKDAERKVEAAARVISAPVADQAGVDRLKAAFDHAAEYARSRGRGIKRQRITIGNMTISPAKASSANPGALYVTNGNDYLGKVQSGRFLGVRACTEAQEKQVLAFIADPKAAAIAYGIETGVCCVCNAQLTNEASIKAGIGPICATKMGW